MYPNQLIELINRCVPGKVRIGKIDLFDRYTLFEVEEEEVRNVLDSMNGYEVDGRDIVVKRASDKLETGKGKRGKYDGSRKEKRRKGKSYFEPSSVHAKRRKEKSEKNGKKKSSRKGAW